MGKSTDPNGDDDPNTTAPKQSSSARASITIAVCGWLLAFTACILAALFPRLVSWPTTIAPSLFPYLTILIWLLGAGFALHALIRPKRDRGDERIGAIIGLGLTILPIIATLLLFALAASFD